MTDDGSAGETTAGRRELITFTVAKRGCASRSVPGTKVNVNLAAEDEDGGTHLNGPYKELANFAEYAIKVHLLPYPASIKPRLIALIRPSIMSLGATQCAPALA